LQTTLALEYPSDKLEIIFAVQDPADPALSVVKLLLDERVGGDPSGPKRWEHLDVKIIVNSEVVGTNPKINNLVKPFEEAKFEILWVVDATVSLTSSMLARSVESLITPPSSAPDRPTYEQDRLLDGDRDRDGIAYKHTAEYSGVGIVHHLPNAWVPNTTGRGTFGSRLEACYLNGVHGRMYLAIVSGNSGAHAPQSRLTTGFALIECDRTGFVRGREIQHVSQIHHQRSTRTDGSRGAEGTQGVFSLPT